MANRQAEQLEIIEPDKFAGNSEFVRHLIHIRAYQQAALYTADRDVLDLGCRTGYGTALLRASGARVVGADGSPAVIALAQRRYGPAGIDFRCIEGPDLPLADRSFDIITCFQMIEHTVDLAPMLLEIGRVVRPGGKAIFTTPNGLLRLYPRTGSEDPLPAREFGADALKALLSRYFATIEVLGLFAVKPIYEVEAERVRVSRERVRIRQSPEGSSLRGRIKLLLLQLQSEVKNKIHNLDRRFQRRYTSRDLYYKRENFDAALDLMAVCTAAPPGKEG